MKKTLISAAIVLAGSIAAGSAFAAQTSCNEPKAEWQSQDALKAQLKKDGWQVRSISVEHGCYEAKAIDAKGKRVETAYNPKTLQPVNGANEVEAGED